MKQSFESKSYGSIRKYKAYGTCGVVLGMAALALSNGAVVSADELAPVSGQVVLKLLMIRLQAIQQQIWRRQQNQHPSLKRL